MVIPYEYQIHKLFEIERNGQWVDCSEFLQKVTIDRGSVEAIGTDSAGVDGVPAVISFTLCNDFEDSFLFLDQNSKWNQVNSVYDPLVAPMRKVRFSTARTPHGVLPLAEDWETLFEGYLGDNIENIYSTVMDTTRDLSKLAMQTLIETDQKYGSASGTAMESVLQQIFDTNMGAQSPVIYYPKPTAAMVKEFEIKKYSEYTWTAAQKIVNQIGWYLGHRYDKTTKKYRLTLLEPPRTLTPETTDFIFDVNDLDEEPQKLNVSDEMIGNVIIVRYIDKTTGEVKEVKVEDTDPARIARYGRRVRVISEEKTSLIDTEEEALRLANAILHDLCDLVGTTRLVLPYYPDIDLFTTITVNNPKISSTSDFYGVVSVRHTLEWGTAESFKTEVTASGRVVGGLWKWLNMEPVPGSPAHPINPGQVLQQIVPKPTLSTVEAGAFSTVSGMVYLQNKITWEPTLAIFLDTYIVQRAKGEEEFVEIGRVKRTAQPAYYDANAIEENVTYRYRVLGHFLGIVSEPSNILSVYTSQKPPAPGGVITMSFEAAIDGVRVFLSHQNAPGDIAWYEVYASETSPVAITPSNLKSKNLALVHTIPANPGKTLYVGVRAVNKSGLSGAVFYGISTGAKPIDESQIVKPTPSPPTNPVVTPQIVNQTLQTKITWDIPDASTNAQTAVIQRTDADGSNMVQDTTSAVSGQYVDPDVVGGKSYKYSVCFVSGMGSESAFTPAPTVTTPTATKLPSTPTGISANATLRNVALRCNPVQDYGIAGYEWRYSEGSDPTTATPLLGNKNNNGFAGEYGKIYNAWVRSYTIVDGSNYYSAWAGPAVAKINEVNSLDIAADVFQVKIFKEYAGNKTLLSEIDTNIIYTGSGGYITLVSGTSLIFQYPIQNTFDCIIMKLDNVSGFSTVEFSNDGINFTTATNVVYNILDEGFFRLEFPMVNCRYVKVRMVWSTSSKIYSVRPLTLIVADRAIIGMLKAQYIETDQFSWKYLKKDPVVGQFQISLYPLQEMTMSVLHRQLELFCGEPYIAIESIGDYEYSFPLKEKQYVLPNQVLLGITVVSISEKTFNVYLQNYDPQYSINVTAQFKRGGIAAQ